MNDLATWTVRPLSVHVPPGERRNPVAMVRLAVGPLELVLAVSRLRKEGVVVRPPMAEGGAPAVSADPEVWAEIEESGIRSSVWARHRPVPVPSPGGDEARDGPPA